MVGQRIGALLALAVVLAATQPAASQELRLPARPADAPDGGAFATAVERLALRPREERVYQEVRSGNVPSWLRVLVPVTMERRIGDGLVRVTFWVTPDYLAVGSDHDYFLMPMSPQLAQRLADLTGASLPTPVMVDAIWRSAAVRLGPDSIAPSAAMITLPAFAEHNRMVRARRDSNPLPLGALVAGHKKDVVLSTRLDTLTNRVAIYGWHRPDGRPIQPLNTWHSTAHVDYSHGIRLVLRRVLLNEVEHDLIDILRDPALAMALSNEGTHQGARDP